MRLAALLLCAALTTPANAAPLDFELAGEESFIRLSSLPPQPTLINFWRSDCPPCVAEMPRLAGLARSGKLRVITIAVQRRSETAHAPASTLAVLAPPLLNLHAPSDARSLLARFGNPAQALPYTVVLHAGRTPCLRLLGEVSEVWLATAVQQCSEQ